LVGLISYPLYLWHWPLLSFARIIESETPNRNIRIAAVVLSIGLAWLTYRLIERPLRFGRLGGAKAVLLMALMFGVGVVGYCTYKSDGFAFRKNASLNVFDGDIGHIEFHRYASDRFSLCTPPNVAAEALQWQGYVRCRQSRDGREPEIALIGDSHAEHLFIGLAEHLPDKNLVYYIKNEVSLSIDNVKYATIYKHILSNQAIKKVILTLHWARALELNRRALVRREPRMRLVETGKYLCDDEVCDMTKGAHLLYRDRHHLNIHGSRFIGRMIVEHNPELFK
jgi:hypothetical protein